MSCLSDIAELTRLLSFEDFGSIARNNHHRGCVSPYRGTPQMVVVYSARLMVVRIRSPAGGFYEG